MKRLRRTWKRLIGMFTGSRRDSELADEIEAHLRMQTEDNLKRGMSPEEARRTAVLKFGPIESVKERYRDQRGLPPLETFGQDVRYAFRSMRRNPELLVLAAIGIYGVLSYSVGQRTQEIGIRIALGASRVNVVAGVVKQACILAMAGAALGLVAAFRLAPLLRTLLYGASVAEEWIYLGCAVLLVGVAVVASLIPARRAAKLDPMTCLRYE